jgi:deoxycytidine triphosphate deaminase
MSIKSDRWIREMAAEQGMIEPFSAQQVRVADGHKIVSYGTSSYGYDVRCAEDFKIFTNINSTIVDPKAFDEKSFVDFKGPVCIIPPNSFALASTVEYFRIPRSVLTICLGKSTYARCFRGDTRVALVDGTSPTLEEMARRHNSGETFRGYSIENSGLLGEAQLQAPRFIGRDSLLEIELDNGECIHATPDHQFMRRDGRMTEAHNLRPNDSLMPLYREVLQGRQQVYQPVLHATAHRNHKIVAVSEIPGDHDVYCLTVPETGNFALAAGVFVRNCGIIVNVTPLEPEWEGHVTLEFSNTTPLPAKIYANEGVAQMLFFESDEVCETSYRDRGGKYQGQRGVTLPKT